MKHGHCTVLPGVPRGTKYSVKRQAVKAQAVIRHITRDMKAR
ncbi:hypothetical protein JMUB7504_27650 [Staphylococcus aureus]